MGVKTFNLLKAYKDHCHRKHLKTLAPYMDLSDKALCTAGFYCDIRHPQLGRIYLRADDQSVLEGRFVFESEQGSISIGKRCYIGGSLLISRESIVIGNDVTIAWDCLIYDHDSHAVEWERRKRDNMQVYEDLTKGSDPIASKNWDDVRSAPIIIRDKVWIGARCTILKGVTVGEGAVLGACSVVTKDVPPWTVVGGNPAQVIKRLEKPDESI